VRALVAGSAGQLGRELLAELGKGVVWAGGRGALDVTDAAIVAALVARVRPDVVFNAVAYNRVDAAEQDAPAAFAANALGASALARAARESGALIVHFSTDYVFDGMLVRPYREEDRPAPLSVYGASKLGGEQLVAASGAEHLVVRTSGVLGRGGSAQKGGSFVDRILARARAGQPLRVVGDQEFAPTIARDLVRATIALLHAGARGLVHVTNSGSCTWHELAVAALGLAGLSVPVERIDSAELGAAARRPAYSVLDCSRHLGLGLPALRSWRDGLAECLSI
jgi:dTDP-4-dehydrorhamnose reductase